MLRLTPTVRNLLIANVAVFFFSSLFRTSTFAFFNPILPIEDGGYALNPYFKVWQPLTYMFLHAGVGHLFSNMFGLYMFGPALEMYMGSKRFLWYYILTGVGAALLYSGLNTYEASQYFVDSDPYNTIMFTPMVGASGAIFGLLAAFGILFPDVEMFLLFIPFPIKAKYFVILYGLYEIYAGTAGLNTGVAHFAHVGGLVAGYILLKFFNFDQRKW